MLALACFSMYTRRCGAWAERSIEDGYYSQRCLGEAPPHWDMALCGVPLGSALVPMSRHAGSCSRRHALSPSVLSNQRPPQKRPHCPFIHVALYPSLLAFHGFDIRQSFIQLLPLVAQTLGTMVRICG